MRSSPPFKARDCRRHPQIKSELLTKSRTRACLEEQVRCASQTGADARAGRCADAPTGRRSAPGERTLGRREEGGAGARPSHLPRVEPFALRLSEL